MMKEKWVPELETIEQAAKLYGHLVNWGCYRPDYDMIYTTPYRTVVFDITLPYDSNDSYMSLEIGNGKFGGDAPDIHCLQLQIRHGAGGVLRQRLVDRKTKNKATCNES